MFRIKEILAVLLCAGLFCACGEKDYNAAQSVGNDTPQYVYTSTPAETNVSATDIIDLGKKETELEFKVSYGVTDTKTATVEASIGPDFSLVAAYNTSQSKNYLPFPEAHLSFPTTSANIASGSIETSVPFKIVNLDLLPNGEYLLPVTIKSVKASNGFPLYEKKKTAYYLITNKSAVLAGRWTFDDASNLLKATVGNDLEKVSIVPPANHPEWLSPDDISQIPGPNGGKAVRVPRGRYFIARHGMPAGPSGRVEEYTLMIDFRISRTGGYYSIFQTNLKNNDDADIFIRTAGNIGLGSGFGYSPGALSGNIWYRLIMSVKRNSYFRFYLDGVFYHAGADISNDRFYLDPAGVILFGDEDGEDGENGDFDVAEVAIYEGAMGEVRIKSLGGAGN